MKHVDPVCHEADPFVGIPVEAEGEIRLPAALDVGRDAQRLKEEETSAIELGDFKLGMVAASRTRAQLGRPSQSEPVLFCRMHYGRTQCVTHCCVVAVHPGDDLSPPPGFLKRHVVKI